MRCQSGVFHTCKLAGVIVMVAALAACSKKPQQQLAQGANAALAGPATPGTAREFAVNVGDRVYFTTDSSELTPQAQKTLSRQAQWLKRYQLYSITIEGHADERGTREYNIALGARRATAVKTFLAGLGVGAHRMRTISYGKERPVAVCDDISCWSQNRRAVTKLSGRAGS
ncbi:MAG: peptidoglycan-associated lipoprotein Pal [Hyphomicrobiales bacterium]|nr:peptidoglycan-associated lipoprotein Pal [Hyphomicrobiales bacterium]